MAHRPMIPNTGAMRTWTEDLTTRALDAATEPFVVIVMALVLLAVFSGLAGRVVLFIESRIGRHADG